MSFDHTRRNNTETMKPAELKILEAIEEVEKMGADERLSKTQILLIDAKNMLGDYIDSSD